MAGGLLVLVSEGQQNLLINGNPQTSFFKAGFKRYTNFGMQKFRVDYDGNTQLSLNDDTTFKFPIPRNGDLLLDCFVSVDLPTIWSPIMPPQVNPITGLVGNWAPYDFKWIEYLGAQMIREITITCGNQTLQRYSGRYLLAAVQRDFSASKKALFEEMIGHVPELYDPASAGIRTNMYPSAYYTDAFSGPEPSIRGRTLYIPLNAWFGLKTQQAFPLVALQYNILQINVTFRPVRELFQIRDVLDEVNDYPYVAPNFNAYYMQFYRFLQPPPDIALGIGSYVDKRTLWNSNIHLVCTYGFLSAEEQKEFASAELRYIIKNVYEDILRDVAGSRRLELTNSLGLASDYLFFFQRSDVNLRNEWSNYTNWAYRYAPNLESPAPTQGNWQTMDASGNTIIIGPGVNPTGRLTGLIITNQYNPQNARDILRGMSILIDGEYLENPQPAGVYNWLEKYTKTPGNAPNGLYCYNFCLNTDPFVLQPSGACNMSRFTRIEFEIDTIMPNANPLAQTLVICDPATGAPIGVNKPTWDIYEYQYDLRVFTEKLNFVVFKGGNAGLEYAL